ncbi:hypothetical protein [Paenibacillus anseongense]|uniref:hypothetical protein n=1 Tax=Paenibacillus anseongense TaxID=2682845 RepID=UPI002DBB0615|nr:hypothetical protein [Paenibacillus anseongense]MEC0269696.1 hypothetical protein [Paenibacillus anseongense]
MRSRRSKIEALDGSSDNEMNFLYLSTSLESWELAILNMNGNEINLRRGAGFFTSMFRETVHLCNFHALSWLIIP